MIYSNEWKTMWTIIDCFVLSTPHPPNPTEEGMGGGGGGGVKVTGECSYYSHYFSPITLNEQLAWTAVWVSLPLQRSNTSVQLVWRESMKQLSTTLLYSFKLGNTLQRPCIEVWHVKELWIEDAIFEGRERRTEAESTRGSLPPRPLNCAASYCKRFRSTSSDSVVSLDQSLRETNGADQWNKFKNEFLGPLHWFPAATDPIARLSQKVDRGIRPNRLTWLEAPSHYQAHVVGQTDFNVTVGQCVVSDRNLARVALIRHKRLGDGEVRMSAPKAAILFCPTVVGKCKGMMDRDFKRWEVPWPIIIMLCRLTMTFFFFFLISSAYLTTQNSGRHWPSNGQGWHPPPVRADSEPNICVHVTPSLHRQKRKSDKQQNQQTLTENSSGQRWTWRAATITTGQSVVIVVTWRQHDAGHGRQLLLCDVQLEGYTVRDYVSQLFSQGQVQE